MSASCHSRFTAGTHWTGGWDSPIAGMANLEKGRVRNRTMIPHVQPLAQSQCRMFCRPRETAVSIFFGPYEHETAVLPTGPRLKPQNSVVINSRGWQQENERGAVCSKAAMGTNRRDLRRIIETWRTAWRQLGAGRQGRRGTKKEVGNVMANSCDNQQVMLPDVVQKRCDCHGAVPAVGHSFGDARVSPEYAWHTSTCLHDTHRRKFTFTQFRAAFCEIRVSSDALQN
jgi:hypothetical protein